MYDEQDGRRFREDQADSTGAILEAVGRASEALEYVERARGHLYSFHQLTGRADILFGEAADLLVGCGERVAGEKVRDEVVGRNVLDGRWTFQVVDEYDLLYHDAVIACVRELERRYQNGRRHVFEARMKEDRRSSDRAGHEHRPPAAHDSRIEVDPHDPR